MNVNSQNWQSCKLLSAQPSTISPTQQLVHLTFQTIDFDGNHSIVTSDVYAYDLVSFLNQQGLVNEIPSGSQTHASSQQSRQPQRMRSTAQAV